MKLQLGRSDILDAAQTMEAVVLKVMRKYWKEYGEDYLKELRHSLTSDAFTDEGEKEYAIERLNNMESIEKALEILENINPDDPDQDEHWQANLNLLWSLRDSLWD